MSYLRHNRGCPCNHQPHWHFEGDYTVEFTSKPVSDLPKPRAFGARSEEHYSDDDVKAILAILAKGDAVSNGVTYPNKQAARNAVARIRTAIKKAAPKLGTRGTITPTTDAPKGPHLAWIAPVNEATPLADAPKK